MSPRDSGKSKGAATSVSKHRRLARAVFCLSGGRLGCVQKQSRHIGAFLQDMEAGTLGGLLGVLGPPVPKRPARPPGPLISVWGGHAFDLVLSLPWENLWPHSPSELGSPDSLARSLPTSQKFTDPSINHLRGDLNVFRKLPGHVPPRSFWMPRVT